jgi:hypothetical protein
MNDEKLRHCSENHKGYYLRNGDDEKGSFTEVTLSLTLFLKAVGVSVHTSDKAGLLPSLLRCQKSLLLVDALDPF